METLRWLVLGFALGVVTQLFAAEQAQIIRVEGQPVYCSGADQSRHWREGPEIDAGLSSRLEAQALQMGLVRHEWKDKTFYLTVRLQLVSCIRDEEGRRVWWHEEPDQKDWAEAMIPHGLFSGEIVKADFMRVVFLDEDEQQGDHVYYAQFAIPEDKLFSKKQLQRFHQNKSAETLVQLNYRYENAFSKARPPMNFTPNEGRFPGTFALEMVFEGQKLVKLIKTTR